MVNPIAVRQATLEAVLEAHAKVPEFHGGYDRDEFESRLKGKKSLLAVAFEGESPVGYMVSYEHRDADAFYCWMAGVDPKHRRNGALSRLMVHLEKWARKEGYRKIVIKTRNNRREMLAFLVKNGFQFTHVEPRGTVSENRILLEKPL